MSKLTRKIVLLAKQEVTYGVDPTPSGAADAILVNEGLGFAPTGDKVKRVIVRDTLSPAGSVVGAKEVSVDIECEARGGGWQTDDPLAPEWEPLILACGMQVDTGTTGELKYLPLSDPAQHKSVTLYFFRDGIQHKVIGCRGSWTLDLAVGEIPIYKFSMRGLWVDPGDVALPSITVLDIVPPTCKSLGAQIAAYSPVGVNGISLGIGNTLVRKKDVNAAEGVSGIVITGREPTGSIDPEVDTLANFNPWDYWKNATKAAITCSVGSVAGNQFDVSVPKAQFDDVKYNDRDGMVVYDLPFIPTINSAGDDEIAITLK